MTDPIDRNRLADTHSPYLHQHADNPVNWQPWDRTALATAEKRDVPIFLSIGYAACHWCHVMEAESFQDETIAEILNEQFVPIKVDREERPDLDHIYQTICQLVTGSGGWPLSVWLTPDGRPFYVGTYFPPAPRHGRPGFGQLLQQLTESWRYDRESIEERANEWCAAARNELEITDQTDRQSQPASPLLDDGANAAVRIADRVHGGFGEHGPKFPHPRRIALLLRASHRHDKAEFGRIATESLDIMARRGLFDHLGGGFHRYATDREWRIPHFEKMLYDNAELPRVYLAAFQLTGFPRYLRVIERSIDFLNRELRHQDGAYFSSLDAQSEGQEGTFYVWRPNEIEDILGDSVAARLFCDRYGITESGNFDEETSVLSITSSVDELASEYDLSTDAVCDHLDEATHEIRRARELRERPARDEKILAGWNGLVISLLAEAGIVVDRSILDAGTEALAFVRSTHWDASKNRLRRRYLDDNVGVEGYLDDYAYLARGALDLYQSSGEIEPLEFAIAITRGMVDRFWDSSGGTLYYTPSDGEELVARPQHLPDQSLPSSTGVALDVLSSLHYFTPNEGFDDIVDSVLETHRSRIAAAPLQHPTLVMVEDLHRTGPLEVTITGDEIPNSWRSMLAEMYLPNRLIARRPADPSELSAWRERLELDAIPPIWKNRHQQDGKVTGYICRDFTCSTPLTAATDAREWIDDLAPNGSG